MWTNGTQGRNHVIPKIFSSKKNFRWCCQYGQLILSLSCPLKSDMSMHFTSTLYGLRPCHLKISLQYKTRLLDSLAASYY